MASWSVRLVVPSYGGKDESKRIQAIDRAKLAREIENYVNERLTEESTQFDYFTIAEDLRVSKEAVKEIMQKQDGWGSNGITFHPPKKTAPPKK